MSTLNPGERVYHMVRNRYGTYLGPHNNGEPEPYAWVQIDDDQEHPDGYSIRADLLLRLSDERRVAA